MKNSFNESYERYRRERILESMCAPIPTYYNPPIKFVLPTIKQIIVNPPATIIIWGDDSKTVSKTTDEAYFDPEVGVAMCIAKKYFGSRNQLLKAAGKASGEYLERLAKEQKGK